MHDGNESGTMIADRADFAEFSRPVDLARVGDAEAVHDIEASADERAALARRFGVVGIDSLRARISLRRIRGGAAVRLSGRLAADVTQSCVVTLEPVKQHVEEEFEIIYAADATDEESLIGPDSDIAWPEPLPDGPLDIGEAVAQQISLSLDPYPRAPGVELEGRWGLAASGTGTPFAALDKLRKPSRSSG